ncbi:uncharacterized protein LOC128087797 isoform X2 [Tympanuchus pallidicinctus]|uniref:uncharacterized protein LOC128087797 isoform X2 n=1 Tax=Tympanuchus pallidicinctus TaxID=109042 RepID=UPI002286CF3C|nr:uncharacterized protein LOC128087797 isoform X2 [Tympanuchus pallidicinctus]
MTAGSRGHVTDAEGGAVPGVRFVCSSWPCRAVGSRGVRASRGRCRLRAGPIPKPKSKLTRGDRSGQDKLETLACDRKSQSDVSGDEWDAESQLAPRMEALADEVPPERAMPNLQLLPMPEPHWYPRGGQGGLSGWTAPNRVQ